MSFCPVIIMRRSVGGRVKRCTLSVRQYVRPVSPMSRNRKAVELQIQWLIDWLSMVLRLRQHTIGYTADGFYRSDDPTNSVKTLKEGS